MLGVVEVRLESRHLFVEFDDDIDQVLDDVRDGTDRCLSAHPLRHRVPQPLKSAPDSAELLRGGSLGLVDTNGHDEPLSLPPVTDVSRSRVSGGAADYCAVSGSEARGTDSPLPLSVGVEPVRASALCARAGSTERVVAP